MSDLDATGAYAWLPDGPGLTVDESFNVGQGARLEMGLREWVVGRLTWQEVFGTPKELGPNPPAGYYLADYPPLGRWLLGISHNLVTTFAWPAGWDFPIVYAAGRFGSAAAFALTALLVGRFTTRRYGRVAGLTAAASLVLMPRVFGHAHLASVESAIGLAYAATVLFVAGRWRSGESVPTRVAVAAGVLFGLALLTKVQAVLLPIPIAAWALWHWRLRAVVPLAIFGTVGGLLFFVGWPWLWFDPIEHVREYLGRTDDRASLPVWYLGRVFADKETPWHYPFVMFAVTVPAGLQVLGVLGVFCRGDAEKTSRFLTVAKREVSGWRDPGGQVVLACLVFPLVVFAVPGVAVYDGARLFLVSFPLWAVMIGRGGGVAWGRLCERWSGRAATAVFTVFLAMQAYGTIAYRPAYLSYYNLLVGGLAGAEKLGFEPTYWGDTVTAELLDAAAGAVPEGGTLAVGPVLHPFQLEDLRTQSPALRDRGVRLVEYHDGVAADAVLVFRRKASLSEGLRERFHGDDAVAEVRRQGVSLAGVYTLR